MELRSKGAIIGLYHLHLLLVVAVSVLSIVVEFSFARRLESDYFWTDYSLNIFSLALGAGMYIVAYYLIWEKFLHKDWSQMKANKAGAGWYVWMSFISLGAAVSYFIISLVVLIIWYSLPTFQPIDSWAIMLLTIFYSVGFPIIQLIVSRKSCSQQ